MNDWPIDPTRRRNTDTPSDMAQTPRSRQAAAITTQEAAS